MRKMQRLDTCFVITFTFQGGMFTGVETICEATDQTDKGISPIEASIIDVEQYETSSLNSSSINAYFKNENNNTKISFKSMQKYAECI